VIRDGQEYELVAQDWRSVDGHQDRGSELLRQDGHYWTRSWSNWASESPAWEDLGADDGGARLAAWVLVTSFRDSAGRERIGADLVDAAVGRARRDGIWMGWQ
jgi:hypothetical protein